MSLADEVSALIEAAVVVDVPKPDTHFQLIEALAENAHLRQRVRELEGARRSEPRTIPPGAKVGFHQGASTSVPHPADDVVDIAVKLVRSHQRYRITKDAKYRAKMLRYGRELREHFQVTHAEALRLAHVLVHVGSMALRHALGMTVTLPDGGQLELPEPAPPKINGKMRKVVMVEPGKFIPLKRVLAKLFRTEKRMTAAAIILAIEDRGWLLLPGFKTFQRGKVSVLRNVLKDDPEFRLCNPPGTKPLVWRYVGT